MRKEFFLQELKKFITALHFNVQNSTVELPFFIKLMPDIK
jgi:hypothetical protein